MKNLNTPVVSLLILATPAVIAKRLFSLLSRVTATETDEARRDFDRSPGLLSAGPPDAMA